VKTWTAHVSQDRPPVLVREGFAWGAFVFGPLWLLAHRAWAAAVVVICVAAFILLRLPAPLHAPLLFLLAATLGIFGNDLYRESLSRRGYVQAHVLAARDSEAAFARLLAARPELAVLAAG
jgi:hypothetical protein